MDIIDKHFIKLSKKRQLFVFVITIGFFFISLIAYAYKMINLVETFLIILIGILYGEIIKLSYRIENLEKKNK